MFKTHLAAALIAATTSLSHASEYALISTNEFGNQFAATVEQGGEFSGALIMKAINGSDAQMFALEELGDGTVEFTNKLGGTDVCVTIFNEEQMPNGYLAALADCEEDDPTQRFYVTPIAGEAVTITNQSVGGGWCLSASDNSEYLPYVTLETCNNSPSQQWIATPN